MSGAPSVPAANSEPTGFAVPLVSQTVDAFLNEEAVREREAEINRVLNVASKLDPFDVLDLAYDTSEEQITKQYRKVSLQCHPDKATPELRESAEKAFQHLTTARDHLLDEQKRINILKIVDEAKMKLDEKRAKETAEFVKTWRQKNAFGANPPPMVWPQTYQQALKEEVRELLADAEWRRRQMLRMAASMEGRAEADAEARKRLREEKEQADKDWEQNRDKRVNSWRDFSKGLQKKRKLMPRKTPDVVKKEVVAARWEEDEKGGGRPPSNKWA